jgi:hypothetical protein
MYRRKARTPSRALASLASCSQITSDSLDCVWTSLAHCSLSAQSPSKHLRAEFSASR